MSDALVAHVAPIALAVLFAFLIAWGVVRVAITYAHRRGMLDQPGQRRSHTLPTPRGGGIGIVVAALATIPVCLCQTWSPWPFHIVVTLLLATVMIAAIGWWDDHSSLPALPRFGVQILAVALFFASLISGSPGWLWLPVWVLG
ncbi:MAG TPA: hypothetical protein VL997_11985, partial [Dyella sp.]|nr:hypothetical protein [Dyella sp.]